MCEEEKSKPWTERFQTQWDQRKFTLLNDSVWATGNIVCFFLLYGKGLAGTLGDALTLALLVFDISLAVWEFEEEKTRHNKEMQDYEDNIALFKQKIAQEKTDPETEEQKEYQVKLNALERAKNQCEREWFYQKIALANNISYAVGLMLSFALLTTPFLPIAAPALVVLGATGAVLCFAFTVINNAIKGGIELYKTHATAKEIKKDLENKIEEFKKLINNPNSNINDKKLLYLEIKQLEAETKHQQQMVSRQIAHLIRSVLFETLIPAIILVNIKSFTTGYRFCCSWSRSSISDCYSFNY